MRKKLLICIPAYNEEHNIGSVLDAILETPASVPFDILVINDGSADNTEKICRERGVMVINHIFNLGYGAALKTAYKYAAEKNYEFIIQIDADGQHDVCNISRLYEKLASPGAIQPDIIIGSRFLDSSTNYKSPFHKRIVVSVINMVIRFTTKQKITDPTSGLQGLNRNAFEFYSMFNHFAIDFPDANMVIQMILNGYTVEEIPAVMHPRLSGVSMHSGIYKPMKYILKMTLSILSVYIRESQNRKKRNAARKKYMPDVLINNHDTSAEIEKTDKVLVMQASGKNTDEN